jgi:hypothetical protein
VTIFLGIRRTYSLHLLTVATEMILKLLGKKIMIQLKNSKMNMKILKEAIKNCEKQIKTFKN